VSHSIGRAAKNAVRISFKALTDEIVLKGRKILKDLRLDKLTDEELKIMGT
jgi:hypothetical protein